jgi:hypothetical protein
MESAQILCKNHRNENLIPLKNSSRLPNELRAFRYPSFTSRTHTSAVSPMKRWQTGTGMLKYFFQAGIPPVFGGRNGNIKLS